MVVEPKAQHRESDDEREPRVERILRRRLLVMALVMATAAFACGIALGYAGVSRFRAAATRHARAVDEGDVSGR